MSRLTEQQILSRARASSLENVKNLNFWWASDTFFNSIVERDRRKMTLYFCCHSFTYIYFLSLQGKWFERCKYSTIVCLVLNSEHNSVMSVIKTQWLFLYNYIKFLYISTRIRFLLVSILFTHNFIVFLLQISVLRQMPNVEVLSLRFVLGSECSFTSQSFKFSTKGLCHCIDIP